MGERHRHIVDSTDGVGVVVHDYGGTGPFVLFGHATGFHGRYWDAIASEMVDSWHPISLDFRGHGDTRTPLDTPMAWTGMAHDLAAVLDWLNARSPTAVFCVGHSMGGAAAVEASLLRPQRVAGLWLMEPIIFPDMVAPPENPMAERARRRREVFASRDEAFDRFSTSASFAKCTPEALWSYVDYGFEDLDDGTVRLKCRAATEAEVFDNYRNGLFGRLSTVTTPTMVVASGDGGRAASVAPLIAEYIAGAHLNRLENNTHMAPLEDPPGLAAYIDEYFRSVIATTITDESPD